MGSRLSEKDSNVVVLDLYNSGLVPIVFPPCVPACRSSLIDSRLSSTCSTVILNGLWLRLVASRRFRYDEHDFFAAAIRTNQEARQKR